MAAATAKRSLMPATETHFMSMILDKGKQSRLYLGALNDAERLAPSVDLLAGNHSMLRLRQGAADLVKRAPQHLIGAGF